MSTNAEDEVRGRDELNLAEFPIALLSDRSTDGILTVTYKDRIKDKSTDEWVNRKVTVAGTEEFGLPVASDADVIVALIQHTRQVNNFMSRRVPFTRYELLKLMDWTDDGNNYKRIAHSLRKWAHVTLTYDQAWRDRARKKWTSRVFHIIDEVEFNAQSGRRKGDFKDDISWYTWSEAIFDSIQQGNIKKLDTETYFSLNSAVARRIFRYLDKHFYKSDVLKLDLDTFAYEKVGLSRKYNLGQVKRKLQPAIEELEACGFIQRFSKEGRYLRIDQGQWKIIFLRNSAQINASAPAEDTEPFPTSSVERRLIDYGVSESVARELVEKCPQDEIDRQIKVMLWKQTVESMPNPGGFLYKAITEKWAVPQGYYDAQHKNDKKQVQITAEDQRQKERAIERATEAKIKKFWDELAEDQRPAFIEEALDATQPEVRDRIRAMRPTEPLYRGHIAALRDEHIRRKLGLPMLA
jgi:hypothetical protein